MYYPLTFAPYNLHYTPCIVAYFVVARVLVWSSEVAIIIIIIITSTTAMILRRQEGIPLVHGVAK